VSPACYGQISFSNKPEIKNEKKMLIYLPKSTSLLEEIDSLLEIGFL